MQRGQIYGTLLTEAGNVVGDRFTPTLGQMRLPAATINAAIELSASMITHRTFANPSNRATSRLLTPLLHKCLMVIRPSRSIFMATSSRSGVCHHVTFMSGGRVRKSGCRVNSIIGCPVT